jgi:hypothetical protein
LGFPADGISAFKGGIGVKRVNAELIRTKATAIRRNIERITRLASLPDEQFWSDERNIETVKLWLIELVQDAAGLMQSSGGPISAPSAP